MADLPVTYSQRSDKRLDHCAFPIAKNPPKGWHDAGDKQWKDAGAIALLLRMTTTKGLLTDHITIRT